MSSIQKTPGFHSLPTSVFFLVAMSSPASPDLSSLLVSSNWMLDDGGVCCLGKNTFVFFTDYGGGRRNFAIYYDVSKKRYD
ncbi:unnamed protein product [Amoebophrya sp. A25]|nr:unnamed protein product [Amoebophrya sp. A25]|eukprot:GSA25T00007448001.1